MAILEIISGPRDKFARAVRIACGGKGTAFLLPLIRHARMLSESSEIAASA